MLQVVAAIIQLLYLVLKNKFERDAEERKRKDALYAEAKEAIKSRDVSRITALFDQLRG